MEEEQEGAASLIDIMNAVAIYLHKATLEWIKRLVKPLREWCHLLHESAPVIRNKMMCCSHSYTSVVERNSVLIITNREGRVVTFVTDDYHGFLLAGACRS